MATDAFLNKPSNLSAREELFSHANFVALAVMPDNLMKETGNTEAPNHLLVVQKHDGKTALSNHEALLKLTVEQSNEFGSYHLNSYIQKHPEIVCGEISA